MPVEYSAVGGLVDWQVGHGGVWMDPGTASMASPWRGGANSARASGHAGRSKRRFCTLFPDVGICRRGTSCSFAHSREEISAPLLEVEEERQDPQALTDAFFMYKYKTRWCPIGVQHEWHTCVYAHNYQDARRPVCIGYGPKLCPYWSKKDTSAEYSQRCPLALRCPFAHGAKEQLYHPHYFKTVTCRDLRGKVCPRQRLCAFFHHKNERRHTPTDDADYGKPLDNEAWPEDWVTEFLSAPFMPEAGKERGGSDDYTNGLKGDSNGHSNGHSNSNSPSHHGGIVSYASQVMNGQDQFGPVPTGQQPMVFLMPMPMGAMMQPQMQNMQSMQTANQQGWVFMPIDPHNGGLVPPDMSLSH